ncbi:MAG: 30S ribosome-binding factor RbfA [Gammaproteobacteria bacterium]|nr:MAG: 30S ribosome-binding factor RbfA [Gammaproteobacteria bacterium]
MSGTTTSRPRRLGHLLRRELAPLLDELAQEQGLGLITITVIDVSPDLRNAKVLYTVLGNGDRDRVAGALSRAGGHLRHELARILALRRMPELRFQYDESVERGARLSRLIDQLGSGEEES